MGGVRKRRGGVHERRSDCMGNGGVRKRGGGKEELEGGMSEQREED